MAAATQTKPRFDDRRFLLKAGREVVGNLVQQIREAKAQLAALEEQTKPRRTELLNLYAPIRALPIRERPAALEAAGMSLEQFHAIHDELAEIDGALMEGRRNLRNLLDELSALTTGEPIALEEID